LESANVRLQGKNAVVYGAGWGIGRAVAMSFAAEGAHVFLAGRARDSLQWVAHEIRKAGGSAGVTVVNSLDSEAVERQVSGIINDYGSLDVSFNLTTYETMTDPRLTSLTDDGFTSAAFTRVRSNFVTATAAARKMAYEGRGVILAMVAGSPRLPRDNFGGFAIGSAALSEMFRQLDLEVGPRGVKVACLRSRITPECPMIEGVIDAINPIDPGLAPSMRGTGMTNTRSAEPRPLEEFASAAVVLASGRPVAMVPVDLVGAVC
jgi:NAD(P)-dependent dehydrogenase (short-subunit alcohol dehydrogenase family)